MTTIYIVSNKSELKEFYMRDPNHFEYSIRLDHMEGKLDCDLLLLYGDVVSPDDLSDVRDLYPSLPIYYKLDTVSSNQTMKHIQTICKAYNIIPFSENLNHDQVYQKIIYYTYEEEQHQSPRTIGFFGTHSGSGVSTTCINATKVISNHIHEKVLLLSLNPWDPSDYFLNYTGKYLNDLKIDLKTNTFTQEKLLDAVQYYEKEQFYHLAGNRDIKMQRYFTVEEITRLIQTAEETFDLVIIDAGCHFDNACYAQAFMSTDLKFLVTTQETKGYAGYWPYVYQQLIEPIEGNADSFMLIINRYMAGVSLINDKDMKKELEMEVLTTVPEQDIQAHIASEQKKLLVDEGDHHYRKAIGTIAKSIVASAGLEYIQSEESQKKGFLTSLFSKNTG